jgi:hypothetical protein
MLTQGFAVVAVAALLAGAALQIVLALAGYRARRIERTQVATLRDLQKDVLGMQQELTVLRRQLAEARRQEPAAPLPATPRREASSPAYELASKLARKGASTEELMETCGLSRGEVDLITMLQRLGQGTGAPAGHDVRVGT